MLIGNMTRDPQVKNLPSGVVLAEFGLAMNRKYRTSAGEDKEEVCFVDCVAFAKQAETIAQWCRKGKPLFVEGRLKLDQWQDQQGGNRSKLTVTVENFQFLGTRDAGDGQGAGGRGENDTGDFDPTAGDSRPRQQQPAARQQGQQARGGGGYRR
jgi:single-strand DNA-binding protein